MRLLVLLFLLLSSAPAHAQMPQAVQQPRTYIRPPPQLYWLVEQSHTSTQDWAEVYVPFAAGGPRHEIVECYDGVFAAPKRRVPTDPHDVTTLPAGFSWRSGTVAVGDWCVLRTAVGMAGTTMSYYVEADAAQTIRFFMCPLDNFVVGGLDATPPAFPATCVGNGAALIDFAVAAGAVRYSATVDASSIRLFSDNGANMDQIYIGEVDGARTDGTPADDRPYIIQRATNQAYIAGGGTWFNRLSPVDDTTLLSTGYWVLAGGPLDVHPTGKDANLLGVWTVLPIGVLFDDAAHRHFAGRLRHTGSSSADMGARAQGDSLKWVCLASWAGARAGIAHRWDGVTAFAGAAAVTISRDGEREISEDAIYGDQWGL